MFSIDLHPNPYRLLRHLITRIPPELQNEIGSILMLFAWGYITSKDMQSKLLPNGSSIVLTSDNSANTSNTVRNLKSSWRSKTLVSETATLSSSTPLLPKYRPFPKDTITSFEEFRKLVLAKQNDYSFGKCLQLFFK